MSEKPTDEMPVGYITEAALGPSARRDRGVLIEMSGLTAGRVHVIGVEPVTIGRSDRCTLHFDDGTLSREHARVVWQDGEFVLEDLGSHNGSFVNQEKVERRVLKHGDRLRFGSGGRVQFQLVNQDEEKILVSLYEAAAHDGLTGVFNRRYFNERLRVELEHAVRRGSGLSVLIVDVDHFKQVNDTHGHLGGDEVLRAMCRLVCRSLDTDAVMARYGGEEFVVLMREGSQANAVAVAERLRTGIEELEIRLDETVLKVTVSIGVSTLRPADGKDVSGSLLLARADEALYRAKNEGRNRVVAG